MPLLIAWTLFSVLTIVANVLVVMSFLNKSAFTKLTTLPTTAATTTAESLSPSTNDVLGIQSTIQEEDARVQLVTNFLDRHDSPLTPHNVWGKKLVAIADKYGIDFRLLPAIAMQESNICKNIPEGTYNCLGFGIHERGTLGFDNYEEGFDRAARELQQNYISQGRTTPQQIMEKYTPSSNGSWADSVNQWIAEMKYDDHAKGLDLKTNADITEYVTPTATPSSSSAGAQ